MDQALRFLDAHQHDLGVGEGLGEDIAQRDGATLTLDEDVGAICGAHRIDQRVVADPAGGADER